jgi:tRNA threonylcarbamoyladenosine biosynthesis protein TsaE
MVTFISHNPAETASLGEQWGRSALPGLVIGLTGELGAGKTQLVKGLARGLGIMSRIHSPTFALINIYEDGRMPLFHLDLYRLDTRDQIVAAGLDDYLSPDKQPKGVTVVEWAEKWFETEFSTLRNTRHAIGPARAATLLRLALLETSDPTTRRISYEDIGD